MLEPEEVRDGAPTATTLDEGPLDVLVALDAATELLPLPVVVVVVFGTLLLDVAVVVLPLDVPAVLLLLLLLLLEVPVALLGAGFVEAVTDESTRSSNCWRLERPSLDGRQLISLVFPISPASKITNTFSLRQKCVRDSIAKGNRERSCLQNSALSSLSCLLLPVRDMAS